MEKVYYIIIFLMIFASITFGQGSTNDLPKDISSTSQTVSPSSSQNYILTYTYLEPTTSHSTSLTTGDVSPEIQYFDGLGRPIETVAVKATTLGKDLISYQTYDDYGRADKTYLPYAKTSNNGAFVSESSFVSGQNSFLTSVYGSTDGSVGYAETGYESSPLNRVLQQGAPGASWQLSTNPVEYEYSTNTADVSSWEYSGNSYSSITYDAYTLYVTKTTDENGKTITEYKNKLGQVVQKEIVLAKTRYCYDAFGLLRCAIQPMGSSPASTDYCFYYKYDSRKRMTDKYIPGGSWTYYIYDYRDRLVLTQDANQRAKSTAEWTYNVYDDLNRIIESGTWATSITRSTLVSTMSSSSNLDYIENITSKTPLKYNFYDNYNSLSSTYDIYNTDISTVGVTQASNTKGRLTGTKTKALNYQSDMDYWIISAICYDKYGRVIQTVSYNHLGGKDYITNEYNFTGQVIRTYQQHAADGTTTIVNQNFEYDHRGRLMKNYYKIGSDTEALLSANDYNEVGELTQKYLHSQSSSDFLQCIDYSYNIRGWLTKINDPSTFSSNDKFGLQLYYNSAPTGGTACYNGNISGMKWGTPNYPNMLYRYTYDNKNGLTEADFYKSGYDSDAFDCDYEYDKNGNITWIERANKSGEDIDLLDIFYDGNKIEEIYDPDYSQISESFNYDSSGNLIYEAYKKIDLDYNILNLPTELNFGSNKYINYFYTFDGEKLRKTVENNSTITKTDYCGAFVYETSSGTRSLKYIITPEGRAVKDGSSWDYEYNLTDHLGNVRAVIHDNGSGTAEVLQERHYYPFGMEMSQLSTNNSTNKYLYNGKEHQDDELGETMLDWYDYGARFYDPELARWHSVDPLADEELNVSYSPYHYVANNPTRFIDPTGMIWTDANGNTLDEDQLKNVQVYIFYQPGGSDEGGFSEQTMAQYEKLTKKYGEGAVAISTGETNESFVEDWKGMSGEIKEVRLNYHGDAETIILPDGFVSSAGSKTNESVLDAVDISALPSPNGDISKAKLQINSCHAADKTMFNDGNPTIAQAFVDRFQNDNSGFAKVRAAVGGVSYWPGGRPFAYGSWQTLNRPTLLNTINKQGSAFRFLLDNNLQPY